MVTVTAGQARQRFNKLLESVRKGERFVVTVEGEPIAQLGPVDAPANDDHWMLTDEEAEKLNRLTDEAMASGTMLAYSSAEEMAEDLRKRLKIPKKLIERARKRANH